jgi:FAD:protein FMN transferase
MTVKPTARRGTIVLMTGLVAAALLVRWLRSGPGDAYELLGTTMGTSYSVVVDTDLSAADRERMRSVVEARLGELNRLMSTYDSASELSRFNRHRGTEPVTASAELIEVLEMAREVSERSGGALDVTVGPLVEAWGFGPAARSDDLAGRAPTEAELERLRATVGYGGLRVDRVAGTIGKAHPETGVDLSSIAKGYAAEAVSVALRGLGMQRSLVDVGGELAASGTRRSGEPWRVGIESPDRAAGIWGSVALVDEGIATSGDYRDSYERAGVRYAHIIDPRTGRPIT